MGHARVRALSDGAGYVAYVENISSTWTVRVTVNFEGSVNLRSSRGSLASYDLVPPRHAMVLHALTQAHLLAAPPTLYLTCSYAIYL